MTCVISTRNHSSGVYYDFPSIWPYQKSDRPTFNGFLFSLKHSYLSHFLMASLKISILTTFERHILSSVSRHLAEGLHVGYFKVEHGNFLTDTGESKKFRKFTLSLCSLDNFFFRSLSPTTDLNCYKYLSLIGLTFRWICLTKFFLCISLADPGLNIYDRGHSSSADLLG